MHAEIKIITFEDIFHDEARIQGLFTDNYQKLSAQIFLDKQDMEKIGVKDGQNVKVENEMGSIIIAARLSDDEPHPEIAFMTASPWTNQLIRDDVCHTGRPDHITAKISSSDEKINKVSELLERIKA